MSLDVMKQALEALEQYTNVVTSTHDPNSWVTVADGGKPARDAILALRAAIEQAQGLAEKVPARGTILEQTLGKVWDEMPHTALMDAVIGGTGVMLGDKRIDPASIYKQPDQKPVAWFTVDEINEWAARYLEKHPDQETRQWQGLTDEEIVGASCECVDDGTFNMNCAVDFARAIEAKIREKNK